MLSRPPDRPDDVSPDYKTQASALLDAAPAQLEALDEPDSRRLFRTYY
jgi:hypothetical protein